MMRWMMEAVRWMIKVADGGVGWSWRMQGSTRLRRRAAQGGAGRCREAQGGAGRCREAQGGAGRCREAQGIAREHRINGRTTESQSKAGAA